MDGACRLGTTPGGCSVYFSLIGLSSPSLVPQCQTEEAIGTRIREISYMLLLYTYLVLETTFGLNIDCLNDDLENDRSLRAYT